MLISKPQRKDDWELYDLQENPVPNGENAFGSSDQTSNQPSRANPSWSSPHGYGLVHDHHIYDIPMHSDLGWEYEKLEVKEGTRKFDNQTRKERKGRVGRESRIDSLFEGSSHVAEYRRQA